MALPEREPIEHPERDEVNRPYAEEHRRPVNVVGRETPGYFDTIRWGPVFAGVFTALAIMMMLSFLGVAIGLSTVGPDGIAGIAAPAVWTAISLLIGLFFGGWLAAATSGPAGVWDGIFHGITVWGLTMILTAVAIGIGLGGFFGAFMVADTTTIATATFWGFFFASLLSLVAAIVGGIVGGSRESHRV